MLDVVVTTGETNEGTVIEAQVDEARAIAGQEAETVAADKGYAHAYVSVGLVPILTKVATAYRRHGPTRQWWLQTTIWPGSGLDGGVPD